MDDSYWKPFQDSLKLYNCTRMQKIMRAPTRHICRRALQAISECFNRAIRVRIKTFWGDEMIVVFPDLVSNTLFSYGFLEEGLTTIVLEYLKSGMVFFDIGTHFGYFTLLASSIVGNGGQVHSFEPTPSTFDVLQANVNGRKNICPRNLAVWSGETTLTFNDYGLKFSAWNSHYGARLDGNIRRKLAPRSYRVQTITIDKYVRSTGVVPAFVKIDAESTEYEILCGMERTLADFRPIVSVEVGDRDVEGVLSSRGLVEYLTNKGYHALEYNGEKIVKHRLRDRYKYGNILLLPA